MLATTIDKKTANTLLAEKIYWLNQLSGELPESNLFTDYKRPKANNIKNKSIQFKLSQTISQRLLKFTGESHSSGYLLLLTAVNGS